MTDSVTCITPQVCFLYFYLCDWSQFFAVFVFLSFSEPAHMQKIDCYFVVQREKKDSGLFLISLRLNLFLKMFTQSYLMWLHTGALSWPVLLRLMCGFRLFISRVGCLMWNVWGVALVKRCLTSRRMGKTSQKCRSDISASCRTNGTRQRAECLYCKHFFFQLCRFLSAHLTDSADNFTDSFCTFIISAQREKLRIASVDSALQASTPGNALLQGFTLNLQIKQFSTIFNFQSWTALRVRMLSCFHLCFSSSHFTFLGR